MSVSPANVSIVQSVRDFVEALDASSTVVYRDESEKRLRLQRLFESAYATFLDWNETEVSDIDEERRAEFVELSVAKCVLGKQQTKRGWEASKLQDQCASLRRCSTVDLHVDPSGMAPFNQHHIIPLANYDGILSLLIGLEGSAPQQAPRRGAPMHQHHGLPEKTVGDGGDHDGNGWISSRLFSVPDEIDVQNWTTYCEDVGSDRIGNSASNGLWWGKLRGKPVSVHPRLWDFADQIKNRGDRDPVDNSDNCWAPRGSHPLKVEMEPGQGTMFSIAHRDDSVNSESDVIVATDHLLQASPDKESLLPDLPTERGKDSMEQELVSIALQALEGIMPAIAYLEEELPRSTHPQAISMAKLVKRICRAGRCRSKLQSFIGNYLQPRDHVIHNLPARRYVDPVHFAFASAVQTVLRWHSAALQHLMESVKDRREQEAMEKVGPGLGWTTLQESFVDRTQRLVGKRMTGKTNRSGAGLGGFGETFNEIFGTGMAGTTRQPSAGERIAGMPDVYGHGPGEIDATLVELVLHTERIQHQTLTLASICGCYFGAGNDRERMDVDGGCEMMECDMELPESSELLGLLYTELLEADNIMGPMIRYLFTCAFQPYLQYVRQWLFDPQPPSQAFLHPKLFGRTDRVPLWEILPAAPPAFLKQVHGMFTEAGQQLRILQSMHMMESPRALVARIKELAEQETREVQSVIKAIGDEWGTCDFGFGEVGLQEWSQLGQSDRYFPVPFRVDALHEAVEGMSRMSKERCAEVDRMLERLVQERELANQMAEAQILERFNARMVRLEERRNARQAEIAEMRQKRLQLLQEQKDAADMLAAKKSVLKAEEIRLEQELLEAAAKKEREQAAAILAAELEEAKKVALEAEKRERFLGWQSRRWSLNESRLAMLKKTSEGYKAELKLVPRNSRPKTPVLPPVSELKETAEPKADDDQPTAGAMDIDDGPETSGRAAPTLTERTSNKRSKWSPAGDFRRAAGVPSGASQDSGANLFYHDQSEQRSPLPRRVGSSGSPGLDWGAVVDPRPPAGVPSCREPAQALGHAKSGESVAGTEVGVRTSPSRAFSDSNRTTRSRWKVDLEKLEIVLEEVEVDEHWLLGGEESLVPVSAIIDACVSQTIISQYRCVSHACSQIFLRELGFMQLCAVMRKYFFMGSGDWAWNLTDRLCTHALEHGHFSHSHLHWIMSRAFQESCQDDDEAADKLQMRLDSTRSLKFQKASMDSASASICTTSLMLGNPQSDTSHVDISIDREKALDVVVLQYPVEWPMSLILTQETMSQYADLFSVLMRVRQVAWWLERIWWRFRDYEKEQAKRTVTPYHVHNRVVSVRLWHQDAHKFVQNLLGFMQHQLVNSHWDEFEADVRISGTSLRKLQEAHAKYLDSAASSCFLSSLSSRIRVVIDVALQNILAFCSALDRTVDVMEDGEPAIIQLLSVDSIWDEVRKHASDFVKRGRALYRLLKYRANRGEMGELFVLMTFNSYYQERSTERPT
ncbi:hypothetical protein BSKO_03633 [Bryopsis sp. KO-2023]|nr:hypothetical protein BSKO_03633 [Bryopsis sp. KO-2023]